MSIKLSGLSLLLVPAILLAQEKSDLQKVLERLERLEQENRNLTSEIRLLREDLAAGRVTMAQPGPAKSQPSEPLAETAPLEERVSVQEQRINEQEQTKVGTVQRLPITITGMVLFNGYLNRGGSGGQQNPTVASLTDSVSSNGGSMSQSILGFRFQGPKIFGDGQVSGTLYTDFFAGSSSSLNHLLRLRVATIGVDWKTRSISVGQDKPIISPREPTSLAQIGVSPLTGAGNLWLWQPQLRFEQRFSLGEQSGIRAQLGLYEASDPPPGSRGPYPNLASSVGPSFQGRVEFWRGADEGKRIEFAPGFHVGRTRVAGRSVPSNLVSVDWKIVPVTAFQFTGMFFHGRNAAGLGGLRQGYTVFTGRRIVPIGATGGWAQASFLATKRLSFNLYAGLESNRASDLHTGDIARNLAYAGNAIYRFGNNLLVGLEYSQVRTNYAATANRMNNHYDLAVGYLF